MQHVNGNWTYTLTN